MRFFLYLIFSVFFLPHANAQQYHFVYIQTENKQLFYIKLNEKVFSSTAAGYLIIPKLTNGSYKLNFGFPKNEWPSQNIDITINDRDEGFLLKDFGVKGWGLFNIQTLDLLMGSIINTVNPGSVTIIPDKTDAFSNILAEVTNTPSVMQQEVFPGSMKPVLKEDVKKADSIAIVQINKVFSILDNSGRSLIYKIKNGNDTDSVRVFIPYDKIESIIKNGEAIAAPVIKDDSNLVSKSSPDPIQKNDSAENNLQVIQKAVDEKAVITDVKVSDINVGNKNEYKVTIVNPACTSTATEQDFSKLQKKMTAANNDDERMMELAKKAFRSKCFSTEQVKDLGVLFLTDEGKYNFYDAAYHHVSDIGNFKALQSQLSDEYYITRFKAMLR